MWNNHVDLSYIIFFNCVGSASGLDGNNIIIGLRMCLFAVGARSFRSYTNAPLSFWPVLASFGDHDLLSRLLVSECMWFSACFIFFIFLMQMYCSIGMQVMSPFQIFAVIMFTTTVCLIFEMQFAIYSIYSGL